MAKIDAALVTASLFEAGMAKVRELRARGEESHMLGNYQDSVNMLAEAMTIPGL